MHAQWLADVDSVTGYEQTGCAASMFANRLSWFYNFKGPSKIVDTGAAQPPAQWIRMCNAIFRLLFLQISCENHRKVAIVVAAQPWDEVVLLMLVAHLLHLMPFVSVLDERAKCNSTKVFWYCMQLPS